MNTKGGRGSFFVLQLKMTSWTCLVGAGLKFIFHWKAQLCFISKYLLRTFVEVWLSWIMENKDVSSANNFAFLESPSERSFIQIKNNNGLIMEHWCTPPVTFVHVEGWTLTTMRCLLSLKKSHNSFSKFPDILFELIWKLYHCANLCQLVSRCQGKHS